LNYVIAAYGIVIGSLVVYALRVHSQRRKLKGQSEQGPNASERH
jgi:hypothetical protein